MMFKHVITLSKSYLVIVIIIINIISSISLVSIVTVVVVVTVDKYKFLSFYLSVVDTQSVMIKCTSTHSPTR